MSAEMQTSWGKITIKSTISPLIEMILKTEGNEEGNKGEERMHGKENLRTSS